MVCSSPVQNGGFFPEFFPDLPTPLHPSPISKATSTMTSTKPPTGLTEKAVSRTSSEFCLDDLGLIPAVKRRKEVCQELGRNHPDGRFSLLKIMLRVYRYLSPTRLSGHIDLRYKAKKTTSTTSSTKAATTSMKLQQELRGNH